MAAEKKPKKTQQTKAETKRKRKGVPNKKMIYGIAGCIVILLITFFVLKPALDAGYTNWDDPEYIQKNPMVHSLSYSNIKTIFTESSVSNYHPLTMLSYAVDYAIANPAPDNALPDAYPFHRTNLLLHLLNTLLVFVFFYQLGNKKLVVPILCAYLFAIHPMHVESVAWIAERKDVLYTFFLLLCGISYLLYTDKSKKWAYYISILFFLLSALSKPAAAPFGIVILLLDYYKNRLPFSFLQWETYRQLFSRKSLMIYLEKLPFLLIGFVIIFITFRIQRAAEAVSDFQLFSVFQRILISFYGIYMYLQKLFVPLNLSAFYPYPFKPGAASFPAFFYFSFAATMIVIILSLISEKKTKTILFGMLFYLVMLIPVLQFVSVGSAIISERYTYTPYLGIFFILAMGLQSLQETQLPVLKIVKYPVFVVTIFFLLALPVIARERTKVWQNSESLWTNVLEQFPGTVSAYKNRGNYYASEANDPDNALKDYLVLEKMNVEDASLYSNLGNIYSMKKEYQKSILAYSHSLRLDSIKGVIPLNTEYSVNNYQNRAFAAMNMQSYQSAIADYTVLLTKYPDNVKYCFNRGLALASTGFFAEAIPDFKKSIALAPQSPDNANTMYNISACYFKLNDGINATQYLNQAIANGYKADPSYVKSVSQLISK